MPLSNETQRTIQDQFVTLPKDVQDAILSPTLRNALDTLQTRNSLTIEQAGAVENETLFIMLGLEHPRDYLKNLSRETSLPPEKARQIATDVNEQIFKPIRESLKKIHNITDNRQPTSPVSSIQYPVSSIKPPPPTTSSATGESTAGFYPRAEVKKDGGIPNIPQPVQPTIQDTRYEIRDTKTGSLPDDVTKAIASVQVTEQVQSIGKKYGLHVDTLGTLLDETHNVMRGETHPKDYIRNIQSRLPFGC